MKTLFACLTVLLLAARAVADPIHYEWRSFGGVNFDLQPLFSWWKFASETTNAPVDITLVDPDKLALISNLWSQLPPRPMPNWYRLEASEDKIEIVGSMWRIDATVEPSPLMFKRQFIYLQDPPVKEIQDFKVARAAYTALQNAQASDDALVAYWESNVQAQAASAQANSTNPITRAELPKLAQDTRNLQWAAAMTSSNLNSAHTRAMARDTQLAPLDQYLGTFPNKEVYWLDHFALRTGKQIDGIEVYDLGTAPGLTY
jgi:hypothetical protein